VLRTTIRVEFRSGIEDLRRAAGYAIEFETCEAATIKPESKALAALSRDDVLAALRTAYHEFGETGVIDAGENLRIIPRRGGRDTDITPADCLARVTQLFPEFQPTPKDGGSRE
jgi:hypothetical protein